DHPTGSAGESFRPLNRIHAVGFPAGLIEAAGLAERRLHRRQVVGRGPTAACCAAVRPPRFWLCTSCGEAAPPCVAWLMAAVGGCCSRALLPACEDGPPPCVA